MRKKVRSYEDKKQINSPCDPYLEINGTFLFKPSLIDIY